VALVAQPAVSYQWRNYRLQTVPSPRLLFIHVWTSRFYVSGHFTQRCSYIHKYRLQYKDDARIEHYTNKNLHPPNWWQFHLVVMVLVTATKLLCVEPSQYWDGWPFTGTLSLTSHSGQLSLLSSAGWEMRVSGSAVWLGRSAVLHRPCVTHSDMSVYRFSTPPVLMTGEWHSLPLAVLFPVGSNDPKF